MRVIVTLLLSAFAAWSCPAPPGRTGSACVPLADGRFLILGGGNTNTVDLYDAADDSSIPVGSMSTARWGHTATALSDGRILIAGGHTFSGATASLETFDPAARRFTPLTATLSSPQAGHSASLLPDGRVLVGGDIFDPSTGVVALAPYPKTITFSGETWYVKTGSGKVGPGPNYFSDSSKNVWVDTAGRLHLKITRSGNRWTCAEVISARSFGYGTYRFNLASSVDNLDPNVVLGLFTWNDDPAFHNRELDIEFSRWGNRNNQNAQYVVQPYTDPLNMFRFQHPAGASVQEISWQPGQVVFQSTNAGGTVASRTMTNGIPQAGGENARFNLWLFQGRAPSDRKEAEVIVQSFDFR
jgi:hypothetical protein